MSTVEDFIARIEGTCGAERDTIVTFKYDKKDEAIARIFDKSELKKSLAGIIFELAFRENSFRLYSSGKVIFRGIKSKEELRKILAALLL